MSGVGALFDIALFQGVPGWRLGLLGTVFFAAYFIKGATGFGSLTPAVVLGALLIEPHHAVLLALVANLVSQVQFVLPGLREGDWAIAGRVVTGNFLGTAVGVWIFGRVESATLLVLLGVVLGGVVAADMGNLFDRLAERIDITRPVVVSALATLSGLISGVTGAGGLLFLALYLRMACPEKRRLRGTILLLSTLVVAWRASVLAAAGFFTWDLLLAGLALAPAIVLGGIAGTRCYRVLSERRFRRIFQGVVLLGSIGLIARGLGSAAEEG